MDLVRSDCVSWRPWAPGKSPGYWVNTAYLTTSIKTQSRVPRDLSREPEEIWKRSSMNALAVDVRLTLREMEG